jgi:hypothetical protein
MLLNLVKKDALLVKKYLLIMSAAAVVLPLFIKAKTDLLAGGGFLAFFISTLFIQFIIFNSISMIEYKYKGSALLSATPYGRAALVRSKYLFLLILFACCYVLYTLTAMFIVKSLELLSLSDVTGSFLILTVVFSTIIPVQYRFGFEKSKFIFFFSIFITPFLAPIILKFVQDNNISFRLALPSPQFVQELVPILLALVIGVMSMVAAIRIYEKQNL